MPETRTEERARQMRRYREVIHAGSQLDVISAGDLYPELLSIVERLAQLGYIVDIGDYYDSKILASARGYRDLGNILRGD